MILDIYGRNQSQYDHIKINRIVCNKIPDLYDKHKTHAVAHRHTHLLIHAHTHLLIHAHTHIYIYSLQNYSFLLNKCFLVSYISEMVMTHEHMTCHRKSHNFANYQCYVTLALLESEQMNITSLFCSEFFTNLYCVIISYCVSTEYVREYGMIT